MELIKYNTSDFKPMGFRSFVNRFFNDEFSGGSMTSFTPKVDVAETDNEFEIQAFLPGVNKKDIKVDVIENELTIRGERKFEHEKKEKNYHSVESCFGSFTRSFYLPDFVNGEKVDASYVDGVLKIKLPKDKKKETTKQITIK